MEVFLATYNVVAEMEATYYRLTLRRMNKTYKKKDHERYRHRQRKHDENKRNKKQCVHTLQTNKYIVHLPNKPTTTTTKNRQVQECTYISSRHTVLEKAGT